MESGVAGAGGDTAGAVCGGSILVGGGGNDLAGIFAGGFGGVRLVPGQRRIWRAGDDPKYRRNVRDSGGAGVGDHGDEIRFRAVAAGSAEDGASLGVVCGGGVRFRKRRHGRGDSACAVLGAVCAGGSATGGTFGDWRGACVFWRAYRSTNGSAGRVRSISNDRASEHLRGTGVVPADRSGSVARGVKGRDLGLVGGAGNQLGAESSRVAAGMREGGRRVSVRALFAGIERVAPV